MKKRYPIIAGLLCLVVGGLLALPILLTLAQSDRQLAQAHSAVVAPIVQPAAATPTISGVPSHITMDSVNISVDVAPGYYNKAKGTWTLGPTEAYWATPTAQLNNKTGNTYIYGHNRNQVFTRLLNLSIGDKAVLTTTNGYTFTYILTSMRDVQPGDTSVLDQTASPELSVQTCSGAWYQHRRIYTFNFVEVHKNV